MTRQQTSSQAGKLQKEIRQQENPQPGSQEALTLAYEALRNIPGGFEPGELECPLADVKEGRRQDAIISP